MTVDCYRAEIRDEGAYMRIVIHGHYSLERGKQLINLIRDAAKAAGRTRVLLDARDVPQPMPAVDAYDLGQLAAEAFRGLRVADIDPVDATDGLAETVARNRGINGRMFASEPEALAWLLGEAP